MKRGWCGATTTTARSVRLAIGWRGETSPRLVLVVPLLLWWVVLVVPSALLSLLPLLLLPLPPAPRLARPFCLLTGLLSLHPPPAAQEAGLGGGAA